jgi:hypothetical protein
MTLLGCHYLAGMPSLKLAILWETFLISFLSAIGADFTGQFAGILVIASISTFRIANTQRKACSKSRPKSCNTSLLGC